MPHTVLDDVKRSAGLFAPLKTGIFLLLAGAAMLMGGCAGEDKYVEIVIAGSGGEASSVQPAGNAAKGGTNISGAHRSTVPAEEPSVDEAGTDIIADVSSGEDCRPQPTAPPVQETVETPLIIPEIMYDMLPEVTVRPVFTAPPIQTPVPTPAPTPVPTPTPEPTPDNEKLMQAELDDVYTEYVEEWDRLYKEYEAKCAPLLQSLEMMGEPSDDPEYIAAKEALEAELEVLGREFAEREEQLDAEYFALYSAVYEKYGM